MFCEALQLVYGKASNLAAVGKVICEALEEYRIHKVTLKNIYKNTKDALDNFPALFSNSCLI